MLGACDSHAPHEKSVGNCGNSFTACPLCSATISDCTAPDFPTQKTKVGAVIMHALLRRVLPHTILCAGGAGRDNSVLIGVISFINHEFTPVSCLQAWSIGPEKRACGQL